MVRYSMKGYCRIGIWETAGNMGQVVLRSITIPIPLELLEYVREIGRG